MSASSSPGISSSGDDEDEDEDGVGDSNPFAPSQLDGVVSDD